MSLSKQQMIGAVGGGAFAIGVLALGWLLFSAWSEKGSLESNDEDPKSGLAGQEEEYSSLVNAAVYPSKSSINSVKSNATSYAEWYDSAIAVAAKGDKAMSADEEPSAFKQRLQGEVRRMLSLVGGVSGKIAAPTFLFGFDQFLGESVVLPSKEEVPRLAAQLDMISGMVDIFAEAGVHEVKSIVRVEEKSSEADGASNNAGAKKPAQKKDAADDKQPKTTKQTFVFELTARPEAIVEMLNGLTSSKRFIVVRDLSLKGADVIVERLNAAEKAKSEEGAPKTAAPRRRGRGAAAQAVADNPALQAAMERIVADPEGDDPMTVNFTVDVYDFGRGTNAAEAAKPAEAPAAAEAKAEEQKPAEAKAEEKKPAEAKAAEQKPAEAKAEEKKPAEAKAAEQKPAEAKAAEQKPAEKPAAEKKEDK